MRLRAVSPDMPGWRRQKHGRGFAYLDGTRRLSADEVERCKALVIPPAWRDVWICPHDNGHLQAVGTDDADLDRVCALAFRMLDLGAFRIGSERYAEDNGSYGLLTLERRHVHKVGSGLSFTYLAKSGQKRSVETQDTSLCAALEVLRARRGPGEQRLLSYRDGRQWSELRPAQLNAYLKGHLGEESSAKDFRTWQANVIAAAALAVRPAATPTARKCAIAETMRATAEYLGNTPAVARSGYVDPRLVELYERGSTIDPLLARRQMPHAGRANGAKLEAAVLSLLAD